VPAATVLAAALLPALGPLASAATIGAGGPLAWLKPEAQPCAELCDAGWALDRMRGVMPQAVHAEFRRRIDAGQPMTHGEVASGDLILAVSYASAGIPHVDLTRRVARFPEGVHFPADGHAVGHEGLEYRFVRVETWDNWALVIDAARPEGLGEPDHVPAYLASAGPGGAGLSGGGGGAGGGGAGGSGGSAGVWSGGSGGGGGAHRVPLPLDPTPPAIPSRRPFRCPSRCRAALPCSAAR
jgi:hypothetical protein